MSGRIHGFTDINAIFFAAPVFGYIIRRHFVKHINNILLTTQQRNAICQFRQWFVGSSAAAAAAAATFRGSGLLLFLFLPLSLPPPPPPPPHKSVPRPLTWLHSIWCCSWACISRNCQQWRCRCHSYVLVYIGLGGK